MKQVCKKTKSLLDKKNSPLMSLSSCHTTNVTAAVVKRALFSSYNAEPRTSFNGDNNRLATLMSYSLYSSFEYVFIKAANASLVSMNSKHQRTAHRNVINLSNRNITMVEETLLSRGLSFCPTSKLDEVQICQSTDISL